MLFGRCPTIIVVCNRNWNLLWLILLIDPHKLANRRMRRHRQIRLSIRMVEHLVEPQTYLDQCLVDLFTLHRHHHQPDRNRRTMSQMNSYYWYVLRIKHIHYLTMFNLYLEMVTYQLRNIHYDRHPNARRGQMFLHGSRVCVNIARLFISLTRSE
jgi:hypothetical protein